ncbi:peptidylprolyl isomerase [Campylobacter sp. IFREMER_LSEM_CL1904]|uniref:peptidylprolyl isomerase n=1 Tax=unclassified Campylobacter TaxID=2593542 RepID=UPI00126EF8C8|nr:MULTISPECIES: peptidylprolyl isomerase [unclassified Campylobacter]EAL5902574.1 peptidylprolyl isomerase [Campylobacter lari]MCV3427540.1 peptidylprolyl isomerase [Campylobacter sp. IFREMER_LSEM_CL1904]MCV3479664.1 peptidylprolyl isomerase [Campylobacter sp. CNRCH_2015_1657]MCV3548518.1 peptidylprolyl isomerase [Campylobacter sp. CNRCH_2013_0671h]
MLTWMQHHKKYLVITIWISVIAFVGAGFVGWGSYDFNTDRSNSVAKVGDEKISYDEFNLKYSQLFNYYSQLNNGNYTQEQAQKDGLDTQAINELIQEKLLLSYAKTLGLNVSEEEIAYDLAHQKIFHNASGVFDKDLYYNLLARNNYTPKAYEKIIHDELLLKKINAILNLQIKQNELDMFGASFLMQDNLKIQIIKLDNKNIPIDEKELKQTWEKNKNLYKTQKSYELATYFLDPNTITVVDKEIQAYYEENKNDYKDFAGKILSLEQSKDKVIKDLKLSKLKLKANESYVALRKNELSFDKNITISDADIYYPLENIQKAKENDFIKPFKFENGYMIAKLIKINPIQTMTFKQAKNEVSKLYIREKTKTLLEEKAKLALDNFQGIDIGTYSRDSSKGAKVGEMINDAEFSEFLMHVFDSNKAKSYVLFDDKAIVYEITKQTLENKDKEEIYKFIIEQSAKQTKQALLKEELLKKLIELYPIQRYYKGNTN